MGNRNAVEYFTGTGTNDNDVLFTAQPVEKHSEFALMSTTGAVDVFVSLDGVNFSTAPLAMEDQGATTSTTYVLVTAALRLYKFSGKYRCIRVLQNGATAAAATLMCGSPGES
jgi:hypothetical protein